MNNHYHNLILGGGPIAASTAYFLSLEKNEQAIGLITQEPGGAENAAYLQAGGSLRWFWPDDLKTEMTKQTADFISVLNEQGVDLSLIKDNYLFLHRGKYVPSLNLSSKKLVAWFLEQAKGLEVHTDAVISAVEKQDNGWKVITTKGEYTADKVLLALGANNKQFANVDIEEEKRQLFVLDIPVGDTEKNFPHTIVPVQEGIAYVFIKQFPEGLRFVVGQEDVIDGNSEEAPDVQLKEMLDAGLGAIMPFLKEGKVEKHLWAVDVKNKNLLLEETQPGLWAANCGSAVRACVWIGREVAKKLQD